MEKSGGLSDKKRSGPLYIVVYFKNSQIKCENNENYATNILNLGSTLADTNIVVENK